MKVTGMVFKAPVGTSKPDRDRPVCKCQYFGEGLEDLRSAHLTEKMVGFGPVRNPAS